MAEQGMSLVAAATHHGQALARDALAGLVTAVILVANILSFATLMFPGPLAPGAPIAIWALLVGSGLSGLWIAWKTSLAPMATGIDSPTGAVLVLLAAATGTSVLASGGSTATAVQAALLMLSAATLLAGALLLALGQSRRGALLRFVPHFVVAGFVGATGWLLVAGGVRLLTGHGLDLTLASVPPASLAPLACAVLVFGVLLTLQRRVKSALALPLGLVALTAALAAGLHALDLAEPVHGWYLPPLGALSGWSPLAALQAEPLPLRTAIGFLPDLVAVAVVALVSIVTKTAALENGRQTFADFDQELRAHGVATLAVVPFGGLIGCMQLGTSRLLEQAGGTGRRSGMACSFALLLVAVAGFDLLALVPLPITAGLVFFLGYGFLVEALARPLAQRDGAGLLLTLLIMAVCVRQGYMLGVLLGIVAACLLFAATYARTGVVRQHLSRAQFAGNVTRSAAELRQLGDAGSAIQLYWLTGYLFFGSSEGVFERVRRDLRTAQAHPVRHVVLDFGTVTGVDGSATVSLTKLHHLCRQAGVSLVLASLSPAIERKLGREGLFAASAALPRFGDVNTALAWCEERLLGALAGTPTSSAADLEASAAPTAPTAPAALSAFEAWLQAQLGPTVAVTSFVGFLQRHGLASGEVLYRQGEAADSIDFVAQGRLVVNLTSATGQALRVRSFTTHAVVGEMGFFRHEMRSATVAADGEVVLFTLTRSNFDRMCTEQPALAIALQAYLLRALSDRLVLTGGMVAALTTGERPPPK